MLGGIKKHGLGGAVNKQLGQWVEPVLKQAEKIEGGAEKHGGLDKAAVAQIHEWTATDKTPEAEELEAIRSVEEAVRREELAKKEAEDLEARIALEEVAREANELVAKIESEHLTKIPTEGFNESWSIVNVLLSEDGNKVTIRLKLDEPGLIGDGVVEDEGSL